MPKSLSTFLEECRREIPNEVIHISKPIDPAHYDATAIIKHLGAQKKFPRRSRASARCQQRPALSEHRGDGHAAAEQVGPVLHEGGVGSTARHGQIRVDRTAGSDGRARADERALLVSISRANGDDLAGQPVHFTGTEVIDDLLVTFTTEQAEVEVTLTGLREPDDPENVLVMLFSEDPGRWHAGSVEYTAIQATTDMTVRPAAGGAVRRPGRVFTFLLGPVVPGRYFIAAVPSPGVMYPTERAFLERVRPLAASVTRVAGETGKIEVPVRR